MRWSDKELTPNDLARGLATDGLSAFLASFTNSFPDTAFAENVGLVGLTGIRSRWVVTTCGVFLLILGLIPKVGQIIADLPGPVIGGAATVMFAMVTAVGIQTLHKVELRRQPQPADRRDRRWPSACCPRSTRHFYNKFPKDFQVIFGSSITATVIVVFVLNLVFNHWGVTGREARCRSRSARGPWRSDVRRASADGAHDSSDTDRARATRWRHFDGRPDDELRVAAAQLLRGRDLGGADDRRAPVPRPRPRCTRASDRGDRRAGRRRARPGARPATRASATRPAAHGGDTAVRRLVARRAGGRRRRPAPRCWASSPPPTPRTSSASATSTSCAPPGAAPTSCSPSAARGCDNDPETERGVVLEELAKINRLRLAKLLTEAP